MPSHFKKLQIKQLSQSGQLLSCVNCHGGQISVLRATNNSDLQAYARAFSGSTGPERFVIELDGETFNSDQHVLIGYGERFYSSEGTVSDFLQQSGIPSDACESLLLSFGLEHTFNTQCHQISRCEERRIRLLAAVYSINKIIVANDPFDPISSNWRERFAELLLQFVRSKRQIVVVPLLTYRPECWIDNDLISRIQVGENLQKTVGFASGASNIQSMVLQVREMMKNDAVAQELMKDNPLAEQLANVEQTPPPSGVTTYSPRSSGKFNHSEVVSDDYLEQPLEEETPSSSFIQRTLELVRWHPTYVAMAAFLVFVGFATAKYIVDSGNGTTPEQLALNKITNENSEQSSASLNLGATVSNEVINPVDPQQQPNPQSEVVNNPDNVDQPVQVALVIDHYPADIRDSIIKALAEPYSKAEVSHTSVQIGKKAETSKQPSKDEASDFLRLLQYAGSDSNEETPNNEFTDHQPIPEYNAPPPSSGIEPANEQERREQIRQKFLEAIQRAQERRSQE